MVDPRCWMLDAGSGLASSIQYPGSRITLQNYIRVLLSLKFSDELLSALGHFKNQHGEKNRAKDGVSSCATRGTTDFKGLMATPSRLFIFWEEECFGKLDRWHFEMIFLNQSLVFEKKRFQRDR